MKVIGEPDFFKKDRKDMTLAEICAVEGAKYSHVPDPETGEITLVYDGMT